MRHDFQPPAIVAQAPVVFVRCLCPSCLSFDVRYPNEGYQLAFWPYVPVAAKPLASGRADDFGFVAARKAAVAVG